MKVSRCNCLIRGLIRKSAALLGTLFLPSDDHMLKGDLFCSFPALHVYFWIVSTFELLLKA